MPTYTSGGPGLFSRLLILIIVNQAFSSTHFIRWNARFAVGPGEPLSLYMAAVNRLQWILKGILQVNSLSCLALGGVDFSFQQYGVFGLMGVRHHLDEAELVQIHPIGVMGCIVLGFAAEKRWKSIVRINNTGLHPAFLPEEKLAPMLVPCTQISLQDWSVSLHWWKLCLNKDRACHLDTAQVGDEVSELFPWCGKGKKTWSFKILNTKPFKMLVPTNQSFVQNPFIWVKIPQSWDVQSCLNGLDSQFLSNKRELDSNSPSQSWKPLPTPLKYHNDHSFLGCLRKRDKTWPKICPIHHYVTSISSLKMTVTHTHTLD